MAYMFQPEMMQDGLSRQKKDEEEKKKTTAYTPGINEAQKPKAASYTPGINEAQKPKNYTAPTRAQQPVEEEERPQLSYSGGGASTRTQALEAQWFGNQEPEEEEPEPVAEQQRAIPKRILETESHPDREFYPTTEQPTEKKPAAQRNEPITYTGGQLSQPSTTGTSGSGTKAAMTTEPDQAWLEENGLSWAGTPDQRQRNDQPSSSGPGVNESQRPTLTDDERWYYDAARELGESVPESLAYAREQAAVPAAQSGSAAPRTIWDAINSGIDASTAQQQARANQTAQTYAGRNVQGQQTDVQLATAEANAIAAARRANYDYETPAERQAREGAAFTEAMGAARRANYDYEPERQAMEAVGVPANVQADPDFQKYYDNLKAQGMNPQAAAANAQALFDGRVQDRKTKRAQEIEERAMERQGRDYQDYTQAEYDAMHRQAVEQADREIEAEIGGGRPEVDTEALGAAQRAGYEYNPSTRSGDRPVEGSVPVSAPSETAQAVVQRMQDNPGMTLDQALEQIMGESGTGNGTSAGTSGSSTSGSGSADSTGSGKNPKGTVYFNPSYGQGGKGVKLPYKSGGYSEAELQAAGNKAYGVQYGSNVYEGYYKAPDGKYYPVDQEKAAYYKANGNSYNGWEEPMRKYYQTFGTFYGYRPDWQTAGRQTYNYSPRTYSYSGGSRGSSGASYGSGNTPNNGIYWNGLSRWGI